MRIDFVKKTISVAIAIMMFGFAPLSLAQDKPADNMQILRDKIKADKKLVGRDKHGIDGNGGERVLAHLR